MPSTPGIPGGALPFSGPIQMDIISDEWGLGDDLANYHGVRWYYDGNLTTGLFSSTTIRLSDFYGKRATDPAASGVLFSNTAGSGSFIVPLYRNSITIEIWGAGGGGGGVNSSDGAKGGDTSIANYQPITGGTVTADYTAGGGKGGQNGTVPTPPPPLNVNADNGGGRDPSFTVVRSGDYIATINDQTSKVTALYDVNQGQYVGLPANDPNFQ